MEHFRYILKVLIRASLSEVLKLPNDHILRRSDPNLRTFSKIHTPTMVECPLMERVLGIWVYIRLKATFGMNEIEMPMNPPATFNLDHFERRAIKSIFWKETYEFRYVTFRKMNHDIDIQGQSRLAIKNGGGGSSNKVGDLASFQRCNEELECFKCFHTGKYPLQLFVPGTQSTQDVETGDVLLSKPTPSGAKHIPAPTFV